MTSGDRGLAWFLITDIEGSTERWEAHHEHMASALARHDRVLGTAVADSGGTTFKHTGDGVIAIFDDPTSAVAAAVLGQSRLSDESFDEVGGLRVRMGVHGGAFTERNGDYFGSTLNRVARAMGAAHGGQILVSEETRRHVTVAPEVLGANVDFLDLGLHRLAGLALAQRLYQVIHPRLVAQFPAPRSLSRSIGNLPPRGDALYGRARDLENLLAQMQSDHVVTLIGPGGVGKTALALEAAHEMSPGFLDGAWFCDLTAIRRGDLVASTILTTLGVERRTHLTHDDTLREVLSDRRLLLIVDNCEHLSPDVGRMLSAVYTSGSRSTVLATSRSPVGVPGECRVLVAPLVTPKLTGLDDDVLNSAAVQLFVERAGEVGRAVETSGGELAAVVRICNELDGLPLAIELAAARTQVMSVVDVAERLDRRLRLLRRTGGPVDHRTTMAATLSWSYELLAEREQSLFSVLGCFEGGFDLAAVVAVTEQDEFDALDTLQGLVDKSMVVTEMVGEQLRYRTLEVVRDYSLERMSERDDVAALRSRHAHHFATLVTTIGSVLHSSREADLLDHLLVEVSNLRLAAEWLAASDPRSAATMMRHLWPLWTTRGLVDEGVRLLRLVRAALEGDPLVVPLLEDLASLLWVLGENFESESFCREAMARASAYGEGAPLLAVARLACIRALVSQRGEAETLLRNVLEEFEDVANREDRVRVCGLYGAAWSLAGDYRAATHWCEMALRHAVDQGPSYQSLAHSNASITYLQMDPSRSRDLARAAVDYARDLRSNYSLANSLRSLAMAEEQCGDRASSLRVCVETLWCARDSGMRNHAATILECAARQLGDHPEVATTLYGAAGRIRFEVSSGGSVEEIYELNRHLMRYRDQLGEAAFRGALERGHDLVFDEVVGYVQTFVEEHFATDVLLGL